MVESSPSAFTKANLESSRSITMNSTSAGFLIAVLHTSDSVTNPGCTIAIVDIA